MWIWVTAVAQRQAAASEMLLRNVLQPPFASVFLLQRRRAKQQSWEVSIKVKITGFGVEQLHPAADVCWCCCWTTNCLEGSRGSCRWDEQRDEALSAHQKFISSTGQDWLEGDTVAKSFIHPNFMARSECRSEDNDSERHHHKSVSLFCCIFLIRLKAWHIQSILFLMLHSGLVNCRSKKGCLIYYV